MGRRKRCKTSVYNEHLSCSPSERVQGFTAGGNEGFTVDRTGLSVKIKAVGKLDGEDRNNVYDDLWPEYSFRVAAPGR